MTRTLPRSAWILFGALPLLLAARSIFLGASARDVTFALGFELVYAFVPGWFAWRALRTRAEDWLHDFGASWALGECILCLVSVLLALAGASELLPWFPLLLAPACALAARGRGAHLDPPSARASMGLGETLGLLVLVALAVERTSMRTAWLDTLLPDLLFHAGNAAEFARGLPMLDPRVHGQPLTYHFFSYAAPAGCERVTGVPIPELILRSQAAVIPVLLVVQVHVLARQFAARAVGALLGTALVVLHADLGVALDRLFRLAPKTLGFDSPLEFGLYLSPSTVLGLVVFTTLALNLRRWFADEGGGRARTLVVIALLSATAAGVKGSMIPVAIAAFGAVLVLDLARGRLVRRHLVALCVAILAAAPMTVHLTTGAENYAASMFHWDPGATLALRGGLWNEWIRANGFGVLTVLLFPLWTIGHLGPGSVGGLWLLATRGARIETSVAWMLATLAAGFLVALTLSAAGTSQLFFLYPGQVLVAAAAGGALAELAHGRGFLARVLQGLGVASLALLAVSAWIGCANEVARDLAPRAAPTPEARDYAAGLHWIRERTPSTALLVTRHNRLFLSGLTGRRCVFESYDFLPAFHALEPHDRAAFEALLKRLERELEVRRRAFLDARPATWAFLRASLPGQDLYIVWDDVEFQSRLYGASLPVVHAAPAPPDGFADEALELVFENPVMRVYRLRGP